MPCGGPGSGSSMTPHLPSLAGASCQATAARARIPSRTVHAAWIACQARRRQPRLRRPPWTPCGSCTWSSPSGAGSTRWSACSASASPSASRQWPSPTACARRRRPTSRRPWTRASRSSRPRGPSARPRAQLAAYRALGGLERSWQPDVVHLHSSFAGAVGSLAVGARRPTVYSPHGYSFTMAGSAVRKRAFRTVERGIARRVTDGRGGVAQRGGARHPARDGAGDRHGPERHPRARRPGRAARGPVAPAARRRDGADHGPAPARAGRSRSWGRRPAWPRCGGSAAGAPISPTPRTSRPPASR